MEKPETVLYGEHEEQFFYLHKPQLSTTKSLPVVVLVHGGYWKQKYNLNNSLIDGLVGFFLQEGFAVVHAEYRRGNQRDGGAGGWPETNDDIYAILVSLYYLAPQRNFVIPSVFLFILNCHFHSLLILQLDIERVMILGHSAGGTLALWPCTSGALERVIPQHFSQTAPSLPFLPRLCVALAPLGDLEDAYRLGVSDEGDAVQNYMKAAPSYTTSASSAQEGRSLQRDCPYALASPKELLPMKVRTLVVVGERDVDVPPAHVHQFFSHMQRVHEAQGGAAAADLVHLLALEDCDHFQMVTPSSAQWRQIYREIHRLFDI
eukprot:gene27236-32905_t